MNLKLLCPSYRTRYLKVIEHLTQLGKVDMVVNIGCGEGDYDKRIRERCRALYCCDVNEDDVWYCETVKRNSDIRYSVQNAQELAFGSEKFDCVICIDVLEHVGVPENAMGEMARVLKPGAVAVVTVPNENFPWTYDPINRLLQRFNVTLPLGAFGFGHAKLIDENDLERMFQKHKLNVIAKQYLSRYLVGLLELYWLGLVQRVLKANAANRRKKARRMLSIRPDSGEPAAVFMTDFVVKLDETLFRNSRSSIGIFYLVQKRAIAEGT